MLPERDEQYLKEEAPTFSVSLDSGMLCIVVPAVRLPTGMTTPEADLLVRLSTGYPDVPPDMWWFDPPVQRSDGKAIPATDVFETYLGRTWQRWSRHLTAGQWRPGIDSMESYVALIRQQLELAVRDQAA